MTNIGPARLTHSQTLSDMSAIAKKIESTIVLHKLIQALLMLDNLEKSQILLAITPHNQGYKNEGKIKPPVLSAR